MYLHLYFIHKWQCFLTFPDVPVEVVAGIDDDADSLFVVPLAPSAVSLPSASAGVSPLFFTLLPEASLLLAPLAVFTDDDITLLP